MPYSAILYYTLPCSERGEGYNDYLYPPTYISVYTYVYVSIYLYIYIYIYVYLSTCLHVSRLAHHFVMICYATSCCVASYRIVSYRVLLQHDVLYYDCVGLYHVAFLFQRLQTIADEH